jgi:hypothetical protein
MNEYLTFKAKYSKGGMNLVTLVTLKQCSHGVNER